MDYIWFILYLMFCWGVAMAYMSVEESGTTSGRIITFVLVFIFAPMIFVYTLTARFIRGGG